MNTEKFIECVKKYPILYNTRHENFTNLEKRAEIWEIIASEMNERSEVLRLKWKSLKYGYTKYKDRNNGIPTDSTKAINWCWGPHLQFLDNYNIKRKKPKIRTAYRSKTSVPASSNTHPKPTTPSLLERQDNETSQEENNVLVEIPSTSAPPTSASTSATRASQVASKVSQSRAAATNANEDDVEKILNFMRNKQKRPHTDAVDDLFQSYAKTFKEFSVQTQIMLKVNMAKLFGDAELREHNIMNESRSPVHSFVSVDSDIKTEASFDVSFGLNDSTGSILSDG